MKKLVLGTAQFKNFNYGTAKDNYKLNNNKILEILNYAWDRGIKHFDTAPSYNSENIIGKFIKEKKISNEINLITNGEKYFSDFGYFYYQKNNIAIYHPKIQKLFDPNLFKKNKDVKFFVSVYNKEDFKKYINNSAFDYPNDNLNNANKTNTNLISNCSKSDYTTIKTWTFNSRRFFLYESLTEVHLHKLC